MALSVTRFSWWYLKGKEKKPISNGFTSLNSSADRGFGLRDPSKDSMKLPAAKGARMASSSRKVKRKWTSREERRIDKEFDLVLVPSDGVCLSGSDTDDDSDWSTGWLEPHAPDFQSDDEADDSFAVLVPCYRNDFKELKKETNKHKVFGVISNLLDDYSSGKTIFMDVRVDLHNCVISKGKYVYGSVAIF